VCGGRGGGFEQTGGGVSGFPPGFSLLRMKARRSRQYLNDLHSIVELTLSLMLNTPKKTKHVYPRGGVAGSEFESDQVHHFVKFRTLGPVLPKSPLQQGT